MPSCSDCGLLLPDTCGVSSTQRVKCSVPRGLATLHDSMSPKTQSKTCPPKSEARGDLSAPTITAPPPLGPQAQPEQRGLGGRLVPHPPALLWLVSGPGAWSAGPASTSSPGGWEPQAVTPTPPAPGGPGPPLQPQPHLYPAFTLISRSFSKKQ